MSNRFDTALLERERTRQRLAEELDAKYDAERRRQMQVRLFFIFLAAGGAYYAFRGAQFVADHTKYVDLNGKPAPSILSQVKKQMEEGDPMVVGQNTPPPAPPPAQRTRGGRESYSPGKVPINLYADLNKNGGKGEKPGFGPPGPNQKKEIEDLAARSSRRPPVDYGKYRPGEARDLPKLSQRSGHPAPPKPELYARVAAPPAALAADEHEFPEKK